MRQFIRGAALVVALLAVASSSATASRGFGIGISASGTLTLNGGAAVCSGALTITAASLPLLKNTGIDQGTIVAASITRCTGSLATGGGAILTPIAVRYQTFTGTLPNAITGVTVMGVDAGISLDTVAGPCLYRGDLGGVTINISGGVASTVSFTGSNTLPKFSGSILCPSTGSASGTLTVGQPVIFLA